MQEIGPHGILLAAAASACLLAKAVLRYLSTVLGKQRLLLQNPMHHKLPLSLSVPLPVSIIFPVQLLFFTPACSFSLESRKIMNIKVHVLYFCTWHSHRSQAVACAACQDRARHSSRMLKAPHKSENEVPVFAAFCLKELLTTKGNTFKTKSKVTGRFLYFFPKIKARTVCTKTTSH